MRSPFINKNFLVKRFLSGISFPISLYRFRNRKMDKNIKRKLFFLKTVSEKLLDDRFVGGFSELNFSAPKSSEFFLKSLVATLDPHPIFMSERTKFEINLVIIV